MSGTVELSMFSSLIKLRYLDLNFNNLSVKTANTNISGSLPDLSELRLSSCKMNEFTNFARDNVNLRLIELTYNQIHGELPNWKGSVWEDTLEYLNLSHNFITGNIDQLSGKNFVIHDLESNLLSSICNMRDLEVLDIGNNQINGTFPKWLENLPELQVLVLRSNRFHGPISNTFKTKLSFSIYLSSNKFGGEISNFVGRLYSLQVLNLSHNSLTGHIAPVLGNLSELESLDLSSNQLEGEIPKELTGLTFLAALDLSQKIIWQVIYLEGSYLIHLQVICTVGTQHCADFHCQKIVETTTHHHQYPNQKMVQILQVDLLGESPPWGYGYGTLFGLVMGCLLFSTGKPKWFVRLIDEHKNVKRQAKRGRRRNHGRRN
ncbi:hypothetical protein LguiB_029246 [Lonicera macranthoides]